MYVNQKNNRYGKQPMEEQFQAYGEYTYAYQHQEVPQDTQGMPGDHTGAQMSAAQKPVPKAKPRKNGSVFFRVFTMLTILTIGILVVLQTVFRLEAVCVIGHETHTAQEVINASGLTYGQNIFSVKASDVARNLEKDHTLIFKGMQVKHPNLVYLQVEERTPVALMQWLGVHYVLDQDGLVMDESTGTELVGTLPVVTGIRVSGAHKGHFLTVKSQVQLDAYCKLIVELNKQNYARQITEIRLNNPENIYLVTAEGISVRVGKPEDLKRKVQALRTTMGYLRALGEDAGVLDVSEPTNAKYRSDK
ncbi:MAG: FtsQ-type POTRA domain-containing protein [Clostridiales bacterium]|nr:FtsQ-type POTRA domain-containing protein [Clostridiales bacterium]